MYFSDNAHLHEVEKMMCNIPNFHARGYGIRVCKRDMDDCMKQQPPPRSYEEMMEATMAAIRYTPFMERMNQYMEEREKNEMNHYRNRKHKKAFEEAIEKKDLKNYALISAIYLMTADFKLWQIMKHHTTRNEIDFEDVKLGNIQESGYTLYSKRFVSQNKALNHQ